jgi:hypothetical protein
LYPHDIHTRSHIVKEYQLIGRKSTRKMKLGTCA